MVQNVTLTLWYASNDFRHDGKWMPKKKLYDNNEKQPQYHFLYNSPLEAYLSLHESINNFHAKKDNQLRIFIYTAKVCLLRKGNHISPEQTNELGLIEHTHLLPTHLVRQSVLFQRQANLSIYSAGYWRNKDKTVYDLHYRDIDNNEVFLMPLGKMEVEYRKDTWAKYQIEQIEDLFNLNQADLNTDFRLSPHNPNNLKVSKR